MAMCPRCGHPQSPPVTAIPQYMEFDPATGAQTAAHYIVYCQSCAQVYGRATAVYHSGLVPTIGPITPASSG